MHSRVLLLLAVAVTIMAIISEPSSVSSQRADCERSCGNIDIPYPFGLEEGCYHTKDQLVTCNRTSSELLLNDRPIVITNMVPAKSTIRVMGDVARDCLNSGRPHQDTTRNKAWLSLKNFWISETNRFFAIGCDIDAYVIGKRKENHIITGCVSKCSNNGSNSNNNDGSCSGNGCCEMEFQRGIGFSEVRISSSSTGSSSSTSDGCSHAFVVEKDGYSFSRTDLTDFVSDKMPMILVWAIGNKTCKDLLNGTDDFLCKGSRNSHCNETYDGPGYRCLCSEGYGGNPYIKDNCTNINECEDGTNECKGECEDTIGNYTCPCPNGPPGEYRKSNDTCPAKELSNELPIIQISVGTSVAGLFMLLLFTWIYLGLKRRKNLMLREKFFKQNGGIMLQQRISRDGGSQIQAKLFTIKELEKATNNYDESRIIGKGGYGTVYKGVLPDDRIVAIKKSKIVDQTQTQVDQFINELLILSQVNHRNVVKLIGCCLETEVPSLVYEFIPNGTLYDHLNNEFKSKAITWEIRLRIATETAGALSYLHFAASVPIIHRDVKSMNILINSSYVAKVADFGASRLIPMDQKELVTMVQGTLGYLDPEYFHTSQLTEKSDVYSFGVVLVELLTGKKIINFDRPEKERNITKLFIASLEKETLLHVLDEHFQLKEVPHEIILVSRLAQRCLHLKGDERPTMKEVALELEGVSASMIDQHPWVECTSNEKATEYLLSGISEDCGPSEDYGLSEDCEDTDNTATGSTAFYSMIYKPKITPMANGR